MMWGDPFGYDPDDMQPGEDWLYGWDEMPEKPDRIISLIHLYTCQDAMPWYAEQRIEQEVERGMVELDTYMTRHAEFDAYLAEREAQA